MNNIIDNLIQSPLFSISSFFITLISLILAIIFYSKSRRYKKPIWGIKTNTLVENLDAELNGLQVYFRGKPQDRVTVSRLFFINSGTETIHADDITDISPIAIRLGPGANLLDAKVVYTVEDSNKFSIKVYSSQKNGDSIKINFDYLDKNEGGIIQIIHTGKPNHPLTVDGKIKGAKPIKQARAPEYPEYDKIIEHFTPIPILHFWRSRTNFIGWFGSLFYFIVAIGAFIGFLYDNKKWYLLLLMAFGLYSSITLYVNYIKRKLPIFLKEHFK